MLIYHAVLCHNYELRHRWQVSSILQQEKAPEVFQDVAVPEGPKHPLRYPECKGLRYFPTPREVFAFRGHTRTLQIQRALRYGAEWIFFGDADHIYPPHFFRKLGKFLRRKKKCRRVIASVVKDHTRPAATDLLMDQHRGEFFIPCAFEQADALPKRRDKGAKKVAAGCMQVVRLSVVQEVTGGIYTPEDKYFDKHLWKHGQKARSDVWFRVQFGQLLIPLPRHLHLCHSRDKEAGRHLDDQR